MEEAGSGAAEKGSTRSASGGAEGAREALAVYLGAARSAARSRSEMTRTRSAEAYVLSSSTLAAARMGACAARSAPCCVSM